MFKHLFTKLFGFVQFDRMVKLIKTFIKCLVRNAAEHLTFIRLMGKITPLIILMLLAFKENSGFLSKF